MKSPQRFVPAHPWSPVGYQVVQTADESTPASDEGRTVPFETNDEPERTPPREHRRPHWRRAPRRPAPVGGTQMVWLIIPVGLLGVFLFMGIILYAQNRTEIPPRAGMVQNGLRQDDLMIHGGGREVVIPEIKKVDKKPAADNKNANQKPAVAKVAKEGKAAPILIAKNAGLNPGVCPPDNRIDDDEQFGTQVCFVRNGQEAKAQATKQHKLVFMMHVSGNFEDERFT